MNIDFIVVVYCDYFFVVLDGLLEDSVLVLWLLVCIVDQGGDSQVL